MNATLAVALAAVLLGSAARAEPLEPVSVVKVLSFSCPVCRAAEAQDAHIEPAVRAQGGRFVHAPIPDGQGTGARELVYYAARALGPDVERKIRVSLYKGAQDLGYPFNAVSEVLDWLQTDLPALNLDRNALAKAAAAPAARQALDRAIHLTLRSGAQELPSYLFVRNGEVLATLDLPNSGRANLLGLREVVLQRLAVLSTSPSPTSP